MLSARVAALRVSMSESDGDESVLEAEDSEDCEDCED